MSKKQIEVLERDDEILRERGMTSGNQSVSRWDFRTTSATEVSWMQRNKVMEPVMDIIWRSAAFAFIHAEPKAKVRAVVNDREDFVDAVDKWMDSNNPNATEIKELAAAMNDRIQEWFSSSSELAESGPSSGN